MVSGSGRIAFGAKLNGTEIFCFLKANDKPSVYFVHPQFAKKNPLSLLKFVSKVYYIDCDDLKRTQII